jgi:hypothetical protein
MWSLAPQFSGNVSQRESGTCEKNVNFVSYNLLLLRVVLLDVTQLQSPTVKVVIRQQSQVAHIPACRI